jgi:large subunit ribosomal protein L25
MVQDTVTFQAKSRTANRKADLTTVRENGFIPGIVYSKGQEGKNVQLNEHDFVQMLRHHSGENLIIDLNVDGSDAQHVLIKEIQHHPLTSRILHVDFHEISLDRMIKVMLTVECVGTPEGVTSGGGTLDIHTREIEVECKASDLVEQVEVDVSHLKIGDHISVADIQLPADYELLTSEEQSVAAVLAPRVVEETEEESEDAAGAAGEPEVLTGSSDEEEDDSEDS